VSDKPADALPLQKNNIRTHVSRPKDCAGMDKRKLKRALLDISRDMLIAFTIVAIIMLGLFAYCGIWPPMVVIESGSMSHSDDTSHVGIIDTGDMVFVKEVNASYNADYDGEVLTYVQGEVVGHSTYGSYGDVVIYRPNGLKYLGDGSPVIPIIHRLVLWLELNSTQVSPDFDGVDYANYSFDVPSLEIYGSTGIITRTNYGYEEEAITIDLGREMGLMRYYESASIVPHGGYVTMGDHNAPAYDQPLSGGYEPVLPEWIIGKAWGELPWFGLIKLKVTGADTTRVPGNSWTSLLVSIIILILFPLVLDFVVPKLKKPSSKNDMGERDKEVESSGPEETTPEEIDPGGGEKPPEHVDKDEDDGPEIPEEPFEGVPDSEQRGGETVSPDDDSALPDDEKSY